jgi:peptidoglycan hydrolase CwlO-like protein|tara:strand:- start:766 stop:969 length:204 start_codon:yes stop_codon:yes gene_type:complete
VTEQQDHLKNLLNQQRDLAKEVQQLQEQIEFKRQTFFKVQGAIEYLNQTGVELEGLETAPEVEDDQT